MTNADFTKGMDALFTAKRELTEAGWIAEAMQVGKIISDNIPF